MNGKIVVSWLVSVTLNLSCWGAIHATEVKLRASDGEAGDYFGYSVSISGDYAIVGATWDDAQRGVSLANGSKNNAGRIIRIIR